MPFAHSFASSCADPDLGLHSAAISGNVGTSRSARPLLYFVQISPPLTPCPSSGLAHYALTHGQPENSVLHGLLPLHAASSGGSEQIVSMLIERGADVNAPRHVFLCFGRQTGFD